MDDNGQQQPHVELGVKGEAWAENRRRQMAHVMRIPHDQDASEQTHLQLQQENRERLERARANPGTGAFDIREPDPMPPSQETPPA